LRERKRREEKKKSGSGVRQEGRTCISNYFPSVTK
jgi:hypothetical protein